MMIRQCHSRMRYLTHAHNYSYERIYSCTYNLKDYRHSCDEKMEDYTVLFGFFSYFNSNRFAWQQLIKTFIKIKTAIYRNLSNNISNILFATGLIAKRATT